MLASKKGMSALQIMRFMGFGSYKTVWLMRHKIRTALVEDIKQLGGIVEVEESFIGGKDKNKHWDKKDRLPREHRLSTKTPIIGAVSRKGNVVALVLQHVTKEAAERSFVKWFPTKSACGVVGSFHKVSAKYLPLYVAEFQFRYNNRNNADIFGAAISGC
jgi:hypothetical protein